MLHNAQFAFIVYKSDYGNRLWIKGSLSLVYLNGISPERLHKLRVPINHDSASRCALLYGVYLFSGMNLHWKNLFPMAF